MSAERVDVVIVGSGFGGSITAWRLAECYRAAGVDPSAIVVLERGRRYGHVDFRQSMDIDHLSDVYLLIQGQGAQVRHRQRGRRRLEPVPRGVRQIPTRNLRAPRRPPRRRARCAGCGRSAISRSSLDPYYARAERGLRVTRPSWAQVSKSGGLWAAALNSAGHTCDRVPLAISEERCVNAKWCHTGCIFGAKNSLDHQLPLGRRECGRAGAAERPGRVDRPVERPAVPLRRASRRDGQRRGQPDPGTERPDGAARVQGAGARGRRDGHAAAADALAPGIAGAVEPSRAEPRRQRGPRRGDRVRPRPGPERPRAGRARWLPRLLQGQADHDDELRLVGRPRRSRL